MFFRCAVADGFGEELIIDVGRCRRHCRHHNGLSKDEFLRLLNTDRHADPVQVRPTAACQLAPIALAAYRDRERILIVLTGLSRSQSLKQLWL